jgi:hypothetical protein
MYVGYELTPIDITRQAPTSPLFAVSTPTERKPGITQRARGPPKD